MTVTTFVSQLRYHNNSVLPLLLGAPADQNNAMFSERESKPVVHKAMPGVWYERFKDFHALTNSTLQDTKTFMDRQHLKSTIYERKIICAVTKTAVVMVDIVLGVKVKAKLVVTVVAEAEVTVIMVEVNWKCLTDTCPLPNHSGHTWGECYENVVRKGLRNQS